MQVFVPLRAASSTWNQIYSRAGFSLRLLELWKHEEFTASIESGEGRENYDSVLGPEKCISMPWGFPPSGACGGLLLLLMLPEPCCVTVPFWSRLLLVFCSIFWRMWVQCSLVWATLTLTASRRPGKNNLLQHRTDSKQVILQCDHPQRTQCEQGKCAGCQGRRGHFSGPSSES